MQQAESSEGVDSPASAPPRPATFSLIVIGLLIFAVVTGLAFYVMFRAEEPVAPNASQDIEAGPSQGSSSLTNEEAMAKFKELHLLFLRAYRERDASLTKLFTAPDARRAFQRIDQQITTLRKDAVLDKTRFDRKSLNVVENSNDEIKLKEVVVLRRRYVDEETGENLTIDDQPERQTIIWSMRRYGSDWMIYDRLITKARVLKNR
jgi:hypothetical protein